MTTAEPEPVEEAKIEDLDVNEEEAETVKGGLRRTADPCEGGE